MAIYWLRGRREVAESAACFHEHPVLPQTSWTRECKPVPGLSRSRRLVTFEALSSGEYCHAVTMQYRAAPSYTAHEFVVSRSISNNDIGIDFLAVDVAAIQDRNE